MDSIGELGLGTGQFNQAADQAIEKLKSLGMEAVVLTGNLAGAALIVGGTLVKAIYDAKKAAEELDSTFQEIKNRNAFNDDLVSVGELENRIKSLNAEIQKIDQEGIMDRIGRFIGSAHLLGGEGFDKSESDMEGRRAERAKAVEEAIQKIGQREEENVRVLQLQLEGRREEADILKNSLKYNDDIAKAIEKGLPGVAAALAKEREISAELIKQKALRERMAITSDIAKDEAKIAIENKLNDIKNEQAIKDREADKAQKEADKWDEAERGTQSDRRAHDMQKEAEAEKKQRDDEKEDQEYLLEYEKNRTKEAAQRATLNAKITAELKAQTREMAAARSGNATAAKREAMENEFQEKINEANRSGNPEAVKELEAQRNMARADLDVEESKKTPRQRADERKAKRKQESDEAKARARNKELEERAKRGATSAQIEDREGVAKDQAKRAGEVENVRRGGATPVSKGYSETDSKNLADIAEAFRKKGK